MNPIILLVLVTLLAGCGGAPFTDATESLGTDGGGTTEITEGADGGDRPDTGTITVVIVEAAVDAGAATADAGLGTETAVADARAHDAETVDSHPDAKPDASPVCVTDLSGVGAGDFRIVFTITTTTQTAMALVNQNDTCAHCGSGTYHPEWDVFMQATGSIQVETDDGVAADRVFDVGGGPVNDGQPHQVVVARTGGQLWVQTDSTAVSQLVADTNSLEALPALAIGSDPCAGSAGNPGCPAVEPLAGALTDLCISRP